MTKEEVMSESEGAYFSPFFSWKKLWNILEEIITRFKTIIGYMGFSSPSQDHAQPQSTQSSEEEEVVEEEEEENVETTTSTSRSIIGGGIMMFRAPPRRRTVSRGSGVHTN
ncbi:hypothetical protein POM88_037746 [Heracleum sosnowskyi]|uniref:Uncharacterized protein n=1 Tax=Heracleum sosnowskyi TaxID=360622 RepID=A0AAD8HS33_9APIA|nr:hypothetical protein POM88_037746 [Heracleum sosnowskyi]